MKKFLLSMVALLGMGLAASAADVTITSSDFNQSTLTATKGGFTVTLAKENGSTAPAFRDNGSIRLYAKGTITISGGDLSKVVITLASDAKYRYCAVTANEGAVATQAQGDAEVTWTGNTTKLVLTVGDFATLGSDGASKAGQLRFTEITISGEGGSDPNPDPDPDPTPDAGNLEETFLNGNLGDFTVDNKVVAEGWDGWRANTRTPLCAIANSYVDGTNLAAESWLVSPEVKLGSNASLAFEHAFGFHFPTAQDEFTVVRIQANGGEWEALTMTNFPEKGSGNWTGWAANDFDLSAYNGKTVKVAFCYKNDGNQSVAWEIRNFALKSTSGIADITVDENAPVEYFNLQGVRVANPENGLYIRRQGNKATKVLVK